MEGDVVEYEEIICFRYVFYVAYYSFWGWERRYRQQIINSNFPHLKWDSYIEKSIL
jgi:hypothetical protein